MRMDIPEYKTLAGQSFPRGSLKENDLHFRIHNTLIEECKEYAESLEKAGFVCREKKEISAGSKAPYNVNLYYCYVKGDVAVYVFWNASAHATYITAERFKVLPNVKKATPKAADNCRLSLTQLGIDWGMCYVLRALDGSFIVIDGGESAQNAVKLYEFLSSGTNGKKPKIALWIFTHSHKDHIKSATSFIADYHGKVDVEAFAYNFPSCDYVSVVMESNEQMKADIEELENNIREFYPSAVTYSLHTGQSYYFKGFEIEVLHAVDVTYPSTYLNFNEMSAALRIKFDGGKTALLLGDCMHEICRQVAHTYGDYLKSDILQVTHHGLIGGDRGLYELVDPQICLWSTSEERFLGSAKNQRYQWCIGQGGCDYNSYLRDDSIRKRKHYHMKETITLEIDEI